MIKHRHVVLASLVVLCLNGCAHSTRIKTHPDPDERVEAMKRVIKSVQQESGDTEREPN